LETGVATVVKAAMKKVEEKKEVVVVSTGEEVAEEEAAGAVKAFVEGGSERKAWEILNQFETAAISSATSYLFFPSLCIINY
jgi:hypothetical protein